MVSINSAGPLRSLSIVKAEHAAESLTPTHACGRYRMPRRGLDQSVLDALMISLHVIVSDELADGTA